MIYLKKKNSHIDNNPIIQSNYPIPKSIFFFKPVGKSFFFFEKKKKNEAS